MHDARGPKNTDQVDASDRPLPSHSCHSTSSRLELLVVCITPSSVCSVCTSGVPTTALGELVPAFRERGFDNIRNVDMSGSTRALETEFPSGQVPTLIFAEEPLVATISGSATGDGVAANHAKVPAVPCVGSAFPYLLVIITLRPDFSSATTHVALEAASLVLANVYPTVTQGTSATVSHTYPRMRFQNPDDHR